MPALRVQIPQVAFRQFDPISCLVKRNDMGQSRGFGFVKFATSEMAQMAVARNGNIIVRDKVVDVKQHETPSAPTGPTPPQASLRSEVNIELNFPPNFEGLVLGCIDADFCK